jgi:hypothetical protein
MQPILKLDSNAVDEGDLCPFCQAQEGVEAQLEYVRKGECSCHITAPCWSCLEMYLQCPVCGVNNSDEHDTR